jgi:pilus assembly protein Flp/PilA
MRFEAIMDPREDSLLYEFVGSLQSTNGRRTEMKNRLLMLSVKMQTLLMHEEGQDLIEYALVLSLIAFAAVATMNTLALDINTAYANIGAALAANT